MRPFELRKIGHVVLNVTDLEASVRFYTEVLGLKVSDRYPDTMVPGGMVFLRVTTDHHGVALVGGAKKGDVSTLNHFAFEVGTLEEVFRARTWLREHDVKIQPAVNGVEAGIHAVWQRMISGRLKVARSCQRWQKEFMRYRRAKVETALGEAYKVVKKHDHLMDASRYLVVSGIPLAKTKPRPKAMEPAAQQWAWG